MNKTTIRSVNLRAQYLRKLKLWARLLTSRTSRSDTEERFVARAAKVVGQTFTMVAKPLVVLGHYTVRGTGLNRISRVKFLVILLFFGTITFRGTWLEVSPDAEALGTIDDLTYEDYLINSDSFVEKISHGTGEPKQITEYEVVAGDTLTSIAQHFGLNVRTIKSANGLGGDTVQPGQKIAVYNIDGLLHEVKKGETIASIAKKYSANDSLILWYNGLQDEGVIHAGDKIFIPGGIPPSEAVRTPSVREGGRGGRYVSAGPDATLEGNGTVSWPLTKYTFIRGFARGHTGLDLANPTGTPVYAACNGTISRATLGGYNGGYGSVIFMDCGDGIKTVYAHLSAISVQEGQSVSKGDNIGQVGSTGRSTGPHLHFEVIKDGVKKNPLSYL